MIIAFAIIYICLTFFFSYKIGYTKGNFDGWQEGFKDSNKIYDDHIKNMNKYSLKLMPLHKDAELPKISMRCDDLQS